MRDVVEEMLKTLSKSRRQARKSTTMGVGSRGGRVLGFTRRGHAIYADAKAGSYKHFNKDDHKDAFLAHNRAQNSTNDRAQSVFSQHQALMHHTLHKFGAN